MHKEIRWRKNCQKKLQKYLWKGDNYIVLDLKNYVSKVILFATFIFLAPLSVFLFFLTKKKNYFSKYIFRKL